MQAENGMGKIGSNTIEERINYDICKNQGDLFELAAEKGYDMPAFSNLYLNSDFCNKSFDKNWSLYHFADKMECLYTLKDEIEIPMNTDQNKIFNPDVAWWIGFTYRQLQLETEKSSKELSRLISFEELCSCYGGLHTIDEEWATDMICEKHNLTKI